VGRIADRVEAGVDAAEYLEGGVAGMVILGVTALLWLIGRRHDKRGIRTP
jgi:hypothetical protein